MLTDSHSHIHFSKDFPDIENVISRAESNGIMRQILVGCGMSDCFNLPSFLARFSGKNFYGTVGIHPHDSDKVNERILRDLAGLAAKEKKIVAIGEVGLDYFRNYQEHDVQKKAFISQIDLAKQLDLPVVVHVREAWDDAVEILSGAGIKKVILHTFGAGAELARKCWNLGFFTSFSGVITYPKNDELREVVAMAPDDLCLLETDCPYLTPQKYRGQRNEPAYLLETAYELARVRGVGLDEVEEMTTKNTNTAFGLKS